MKFVREMKERLDVRRAVEVECQAVAEDGFRLLGTRVLDVSGTGLLVLSDEVVDVGETVFVAMRCPRGSTWVDAHCSVARVVRGYRRTDPFRAVGLRFEAMDAVDRALLLGSMAELPPPIPARHLRLDYASAIRDIAASSPARRAAFALPSLRFA